MKFKPRIKLNQNIYIYTMSTRLNMYSKTRVMISVKVFSLFYLGFALMQYMY